MAVGQPGGAGSGHQVPSCGPVPGHFSGCAKGHTEGRTRPVLPAGGHRGGEPRRGQTAERRRPMLGPCFLRERPRTRTFMKSRMFPCISPPVLALTNERGQARGHGRLPKAGVSALC